MPVEPSRELVLTKLHHCFPEHGAAAEALALLDSYAGDTPKGGARVQLAMLKQCNGDLTRLRQLADLARTDYRDVLVGAEYPEEFPAPRSTTPEAMAAIRRRDREQYEAWLAWPGQDQHVLGLPASGQNPPLQRTEAAGILSRIESGSGAASAAERHYAMPLATLDYAPRIEFDTGRFVARYLQVLACLSIASMIADPILFDSLHIDLSPIFLFWAASALKRRNRTARKWVLALAGLTLGVIMLMLLWGVIGGTGGMTVSFGTKRIKNPALWQVAAVAVPSAVVVAVPFIVLMSERARQQFSGAPAGA